MKKITILLLFIALLLASCLSEEAKLKKANNGLGSKKNPIKMYIVPSLETSAIVTSGEAIARFLEKETGYHIKVAVPTSYAAVVEAIGSRQADVAWLPAFAYVLAKQKYDVQVRYMTVRNGLIKYRGQFVVRAESDIQSLEDLSGKIIAYTDAASTSGYIYPSAILKQKGIKPARHIFAGGHQQAINSVYDGTADVGCSYWSPPDATGMPKDAREKLLQTYPDIFQKIRILAFTDSIPNDTVTFRNDLPADLDKKLTAALAKFSQSVEGKKILHDLNDIDGLRLAQDSDYDVVRSALKTMGMDPQTLLD